MSIMSSTANPSSVSSQTSLQTFPSIRLHLNPAADAEAARSDNPLVQEDQGIRNEEPDGGSVQPSSGDDVRVENPPDASTAQDDPTSTARKSINLPETEEAPSHQPLKSARENAPKYLSSTNTFPVLALVLTICVGYASYKVIGHDSQEHEGWRHYFTHFLSLGLVLSVSLLLYGSSHSLRHYPRLRRNAFDPVHIRLTHPHRPKKPTDQQGTRKPDQLRRSRRGIIYWLEQQPHEEYDPSSRKRSFQPNLDALIPVPFWKKKGLGSLPIISQNVAPLARTETPVTQIGDALKGYATDDRMFSADSPMRIRRRLLQRIPVLLRFRYSHDDDDDIEPPLTALLADVGEEEEEDEGPQRNVRITSGVVALGLAQAGCTLASSVGGAIAPDILVQSDGYNDMKAELGSLPNTPRDVTSAG